MLKYFSYLDKEGKKKERNEGTKEGRRNKRKTRKRESRKEGRKESKNYEVMNESVTTSANEVLC